MEETRIKVLVLDMQPIDPPVGGGRLRLLGLYHNLGETFSTQYIGTYDWPGEKFRDHKLSTSLREVDIPLSDAHFAESQKWRERIGGKTIIDATFPQLAHLSPDYVTYVRREVIKADVVLFSHPWVYPLVRDLLKRDIQTIVYDSHNVEGYLRFTLLDDGGAGTEIVRAVVKTEYELCHLADFVFACSSEDGELFHKLYAVPFNKIKIVPNGVFTEKISPVNSEEKKAIKQKLGLGDHKTAIFIGSNYPPNLEACAFILNDLAPKLPNMTFIIAGGVGDGINKGTTADHGNVKITGALAEAEKLLYLAAADIAINPMFSGSGTNIKMFDFMAAGLPVISTGIGSRGITKINSAGILIGDRTSFIPALRDLMQDDQKAFNLGEANRELVERNYSWEKISPKTGAFLANQIARKNDGEIVKNEKGKNKKFAIMSSWNLRCGIAEHTRYLVNEFEATNEEFSIIANSNGDLKSTYLMDDISRDVYPLWEYDYLTWKDTKIDIAGILESLRQQEISKFNIQYHPGFFNQQMLLNLVRACVQEKIDVSLSLHNSKEVSLETFLEMSKMGTKIIVHTKGEKTLLDARGIHNVFHIPLGAFNFPDEEKDDCRDQFGICGEPVIGSFGFLRPHKGVLEALEAVSILKEQYPNIQFLGLNALYPSEDSEHYYRTCIKRINELKLKDNVTLYSSFLEMAQIIHFLHACDVVVLPYHESGEGASAAANTAISAKRPLIISKSGIFNEIKQVGHVMESITPACIATEIQNILANPELQTKMKNQVINYLNENSYNKIAGKYVEVIFGED